MFYTKQFNEQTWRDYKSIRLEGLTLHENVYGNSLAMEQAWDDSVWIGEVTSQKSAIFGLYDDETLIGSTAAFTDRGDSSGKTCLLAGSYIREHYRGQGLSALLYKARIDWARAHGGFDVIVVGHREDNEASRRANQNFGFKFVKKTEKQWGDGTTGTHYAYELRITR